MKRVFILLFVTCLSLCASSQVKISRKTLKVTDLGNQRLEMAYSGQDTSFCIFLKTTNRFQKYVKMTLGDKKEALKLLIFIRDSDCKKGDVLILDNADKNKLVYTMGNFVVYGLGGVLHGNLRQANIKTFIDILSKL